MLVQKITASHAGNTRSNYGQALLHDFNSFFGLLEALGVGLILNHGSPQAMTLLSAHNKWDRFPTSRSLAWLNTCSGGGYYANLHPE